MFLVFPERFYSSSHVFVVVFFSKMLNKVFIVLVAGVFLHSSINLILCYFSLLPIGKSLGKFHHSLFSNFWFHCSIILLTILLPVQSRCTLSRDKLICSGSSDTWKLALSRLIHRKHKVGNTLVFHFHNSSRSGILLELFTPFVRKANSRVELHLKGDDS